MPGRARRVALAVSFALCSSRSHAISLGEAEVHSFLGSPLRVEIPLRFARDELIDDNCITLLPMSTAGDAAQTLPMRLRVIHGDHNRILVESQRPTSEPYATLRVHLACGASVLTRDYAVLLDPRPDLRAPRSESEALQVAASTSSGEADASALPPGSALELDAPVLPTARTAADATVPRARRNPARSTLRLETGLRGVRARTSAASGDDPGRPVLRLDFQLAQPETDTPALVARRTQLRDLRTLMLSGDDTLERLLALQAQVGTLETQLRALQGGPAPAPGPAAAPSGDLTAPVLATGVPPAPPAPKITVVPRKLPPPPPPPEEDIDWLLPAGGGAALLMLTGGLLWWRRRRRAPVAMEEIAIAADENALIDGAPATALIARNSAEPLAQAPGVDVSREQAARAAYLAERFPEIGAGLIKLNDADSVVNGARLYMETGDHDRAEELLGAAIHEGGGQDIRPWLGLFEVLRTRQDVDAFRALLANFRARFVDSRYLPEVLAVGRQIAPDEAEFQAPAGSPPVEVGPDGTTWLNPELDFVPQALARDLHETLMAEVEEEDAFTLSPMEAKGS